MVVARLTTWLGSYPLYLRKSSCTLKLPDWVSAALYWRTVGTPSTIITVGKWPISDGDSARARARGALRREWTSVSGGIEVRSTWNSRTVVVFHQHFRPHWSTLIRYSNSA